MSFAVRVRGSVHILHKWPQSSCRFVLLSRQFFTDCDFFSREFCRDWLTQAWIESCSDMTPNDLETKSPQKTLAWIANILESLSYQNYAGTILIGAWGSTVEIILQSVYLFVRLSAEVIRASPTVWLAVPPAWGKRNKAGVCPPVPLTFGCRLIVECMQNRK